MYRGGKIADLNLNGGDFSDVDFTGIAMENISAKNANFERCILLGAKFTNCNFERSIFSFAQFSFACMLGEKTSFKNAIIDDSDFSFVKADPAINFLVRSENKAIFIGCNYMEIRARVKNLEPLMPNVVSVTPQARNKVYETKRDFNAVSADSNVAFQEIAAYVKSPEQLVNLIEPPGKATKEVFSAAKSEDMQFAMQQTTKTCSENTDAVHRQQTKILKENPNTDIHEAMSVTMMRIGLFKDGSEILKKLVEKGKDPEIPDNSESGRIPTAASPGHYKGKNP